MTKLRVAVLGYGYWGPKLVRNLYNNQFCELVAVADQDPKRVAGVSGMYPTVDPCDDAIKLIDRPDIDAVVVATPPSTHFALAKCALEKGKHVLVEKPLTETSADAAELVKLAEEKGLTLMVDHTFIYAGAVRKIRELIDSGDLGKVLYIDSVRINLGIFQSDVNVIEDLAPHDISIVDYLLDAKPKSASAIGIAPVSYQGKTPGSLAYAAIRFDSGLLAHFHLSWLSPVKIRKMLIGGSKKTVVYDHLEPDNQIMVYENGGDLTEEGERRRLLGEMRMGDLYVPKVDQVEPLEEVCRHFVECCIEGNPPITDGKAGLRVVKILEALGHSMEQEGAMIPL